MKLKIRIFLCLLSIILLSSSLSANAVEIDEGYQGGSGGIDFESGGDTQSSGEYDYIVDVTGLYIIQYFGTDEVVHIPDKLNGRKVIGLYTEAFAASPTVKKIVIPDSVTMIFDDTFVNCKSLTEIEVDPNNSVYASDDGLLYSKDYEYLVRCPEGKAGVVNVKEGTKYICDYTFFQCENLTSVNIPSTVIGMDENGDVGVGIGAFYSTKNLNNIIVNNNPNYEVYDGVLYRLNDSKQKEVLVKCPDTRVNCVNIPSTVKEIADFAFFECFNLVGPINLPSGLTTIGEKAFFNCYKLDGGIKIPDTIELIKPAAFYSCYKISSLDLGNGLVEIPDDCFAYCYGLDSIDIPNNVVIIGERAFFKCENVKSIQFGNRVVDIGAWAFDYLSNLKGDIILPDTINYIGTAAFMHAYELDGYVVIGKGAQEIGDSVFYDSEKLKGIIFRGNLPLYISECSFLKPDVKYYHLKDKSGFEDFFSTKDVRIYSEQPKVEFILNGNVYKTVDLNKYGMTVPEFDNPQIDNYKFEGWYYDPNFENEFNFSDTIMADTKIYAKTEIINSISFNRHDMLLEVGSQEKLEYTYSLEEGATKEDIEWTSTSPEVADIDENGNIIAYDKGETVITASYKFASDSITVNVWKDENKINILDESKTLTIGEQVELEYDSYFIDDGTTDDIVWSTEDTGIISLDGNKVTALSDGVATVTATYKEAKDTIEIIVLKDSYLNITSSPIVLKLKQSATIDLDYYFNDGATAEDITWLSNNTNVAKVSNGKVTAYLEGNADITAQYKDLKATIHVTVVRPDEIKFYQDSIEIGINSVNYKLRYSWYSYNLSEDDIIWLSSNDDVLEVEKGVLIPKDYGDVVVNAICGDSAATISVKVVKPNTLRFIEDKKTIRFDRNKVVDLDIDFYFNDGATKNDITYTSTNPEVIKVENNVLKQVGKGQTTITARYGNYSDTIDIEIIPQDYINFEKFGYIIHMNETFKLPYEYYLFDEDAKITFKSSEESIASVDDEGNVTPNDIGEVTITASYNGIEAEVVIIVSNDSFLLGDLDRNGQVDTADAAVALNLFKYKNFDNLDMIIGDLDGNKVIDTADASEILNMFKYGNSKEL